MPLSGATPHLDRPKAGFVALPSVAETPRSSFIGTFLSMEVSGCGPQWMA